MIITVNGVDLSTYIRQKSVSVDKILTNQVDTCRFVLVNPPSKPTILQDVVITINDGLNDTWQDLGANTWFDYTGIAWEDFANPKLFAGQIVEIEQSCEKLQNIYTITCKDYTHLLDGKLAVEIYENESVNDIIDDLNTKYLTGFDLGGVSCSTIISYIAFDYEPISKCLQRLADLTNYNWFVDANKTIWFFSRTEKTAPFNLGDTTDNYEQSSLIIREDGTQIKNSIFVRGAEYAAASETRSVVADGSQTTFLLPYKYSNLTVSVGGTSQTVGIDFIDDPASYDCLFNFQQKTIKFRSDNKPSASDVVSWTGNPYVPVLIARQNDASVLEYGERQFRIVDKTIKNKDGARERALAELNSYQASLAEANFTTYEHGLEVGQRIRIQSIIRDVDAYYIINKISISLEGKDVVRYDVSLVSTKTYELVDFLQDLLNRRDIETNENEDEALETIVNLTDSFSSSDAVSAGTPTSPPYKWSTGSPLIKWNFFTWVA